MKFCQFYLIGILIRTQIRNPVVSPQLKYLSCINYNSRQSLQGSIKIKIIMQLWQNLPDLQTERPVFHSANSRVDKGDSRVWTTQQERTNKPCKMSCAPPFMGSKLNKKTKMFKSKMNGQNVSTESLPVFFETTILVSV